MLMLGKMSVGVRSADATPKIMINNAITIKVYGRRSASLTMPTIILRAPWQTRYCGTGWQIYYDPSERREFAVNNRAQSGRGGRFRLGIDSVPRAIQTGDDLGAAEAHGRQRAGGQL